MIKYLSLVTAVLLTVTGANADCRFTLNFAYGSAALSVRDAQLLRDLARAYPDGPVALSAHADDDGTDAQNDRVAAARARAVVNRMKRAGLREGAVVAAYELAAEWDVVPTKGASSPLNRRVELFIGGCDPRNHPEARRFDAPGVMFRGERRVILTSPRLERMPEVSDAYDNPDN
jgi:hypothetical protein